MWVLVLGRYVFEGGVGVVMSTYYLTLLAFIELYRFCIVVRCFDGLFTEH